MPGRRLVPPPVVVLPRSVLPRAGCRQRHTVRRRQWRDGQRYVCRGRVRRSRPVCRSGVPADPRAVPSQRLVLRRAVRVHHRPGRPAVQRRRRRHRRRRLLCRAVRWDQPVPGLVRPARRVPSLWRHLHRGGDVHRGAGARGVARRLHRPARASRHGLLRRERGHGQRDVHCRRQLRRDRPVRRRDVPPDRQLPRQRQLHRWRLRGWPAAAGRHPV
mmetsp:Transcript_7197/g.21214  ORF Transcript_7197/g.21214 Transcript_7197/m.21214 type:complete len:216 (+) Transcript_7197:1099-1746(+)